MAIGNLGKTITFEVSSEKVLTFNNLSRTVKGRWTQHSIIESKPKSEFLGPDLDGITFKVILSAMHGVKPRKTIETIEKAVKNGTVMSFVIGGKKVGDNSWVITSVSEAWNCVYSKGELVTAEVNLTLQEYV